MRKGAIGPFFYLRFSENLSQHWAQIHRVGDICTPPSGSRDLLQSLQWVNGFLLECGPCHLSTSGALVVVLGAVWRWGQQPAVLAFGHVLPLSRMAAAHSRDVTSQKLVSVRL
jgi:hypothetical protein